MAGGYAPPGNDQHQHFIKAITAVCSLLPQQSHQLGFQSARVS